MKIRILSHARQDLREILRFYERQEAGAGARACEALEAEIDALLETAGQHPIHNDHHRVVLRGAYRHFCIYYKLSKDAVLVDAVLDQRFDPARIQRRLRSRS